MENISVLLKRFPNEAICGGVLLPGHRVISASGCIPSNFTNIKVQLPGTLDLLNIRSVVRNKIAIINVSSLTDQIYYNFVKNLQSK